MNDTTKWTPPNPLTTDWWEQACECYAAGKPNPTITEAPQTSWLRAPLRKGGPYFPVQYWYEDGKLHCIIGTGRFEDGKLLPSGQTIRQLWPFASKHPVTADQWEHYEIHGKWPDMPDTVYVDNQLRGLARLKANIEPLLTQAAEMIKGGAAKTQEDAVKANNIHNQLNEWHSLTKTKEGMDELGKIFREDPEITAGVIEGNKIYQRINAAFNDLLKRCKTISVDLKQTVVKPYQLANKPNDPTAKTKILPGVVGRTISLTKIKKVKLTNRYIALQYYTESNELSDFLETLGQKEYRNTKTVPPGFEEYTEEGSR